ncbi:sensor histidine kinase [Adhaeribacter pallidiroseus]|uniref:histidine kinase n=1 Tax=Adhaeribacter pallidiroseus TaxID=2072847 RepID=A0A369QFX1_9BACT|nr:ATP-binding protein [Adhaeribacter pallidiroseus]RDC62126.1 Phytochrome-like protein cph1 [Adhaeribacter pallidiroseus]
MSYWLQYRQFTEKNLLGKNKPEIEDLAYWRDKVFTNAIVFFLPVSLVALIPGVWVSLKEGLLFLAFIDIVTVLSFALIAFHPYLNLAIRKVIAVAMLYLLAVILLLFLGSFGPGLLYLLTITIFTALIFPVSVAYQSICLNVLICVVFALIIHFKPLNSSLTQLYNPASWIAVSSNLICLNVVCVALLDMLVTGLQKTITQEAYLQMQLKAESTKLEHLVETLKIKNQELEQFAFITSHDLQEPLRTITTVVSNLEQHNKGKLDELTAVYLGFLTQSAVKMRALITGLLEYSRLGKDKLLDKVDCNQVLQECLADLRTYIQENQAIITSSTLPELQAYGLELKLLFQNLITNAIKFRRKNIFPQINITAVQEANYWVFSVADNGIGIDERFREKIFVIFHRLHPQAAYEGTGIGLAHCRKIVDLHGGKIWMEANPGGGSIFRFKLPVI